LTTTPVSSYDPPVILRHGREVTTLTIDSPAMVRKLVNAKVDDANLPVR
jgi:hypothetical protein